MGSTLSTTLRTILIIAFYFQANITGMMGININIIIYILLGLCGFEYITKRRNYRNIPGTLILLGIFILLLYRLYMNIFLGAFISAMYIALPALILYITPQQGKLGENSKVWLWNFIVTFYLIECGIAIFEFATHHYLFGYSESTYGDGKWHFTSRTADFRAVSICGSPLHNALIVTTINAFILFSSSSNRKKIICFVLGLLAVFAFNARISVVLFILTGVLYGVREFRQRGGSYKIGLLLVASVIVILVLVSVTYLGLGSRLLAIDTESDSSIAVRLQLFEYFASASLKDYLWGGPMDNLGSEKDYIGVPIIENFWIEYLILFGLIPLLYFASCYFYLGKKLFNGYKPYNKFVLSTVFIVNASINNSLSTSYSPLLIFLLCTVAFKHREEVKLIKN